MMKRGRSFCLLVLIGTLSAAAGVGTWKNYTSMKDVRGIARSGSTYWAATSGGLLAWKEGSATYQMFTNADGLSSIDLTAVAVDLNGNIWSGSSTGVIHIYSPDTGIFRTVLDIAEAKNQTDKKINSFSMIGDTVMICTDFGLSLFHIGTFGFGDTYTKFGSLPSNARVSVQSAAIYNDRLWATITDGQTNNFVAVADLSNPYLLPPESWSLQSVGPSGSIPQQFAVFNNRLYVSANTGLYYTSGSSWTVVSSLADSDVVSLAASSSRLVLCTSPANSSQTVFSVDSLNNSTPIGPPLPFFPSTVVISTAESPVIASLGGGILTLTSTWVSHYPNGPNSNQFVSIAVDPNGVVWCGSGPTNGKGFYRFDGTLWRSYTGQNSALPSNEVARMSVGCDGSVWASTYGRGVVEILHGGESFDNSHVFGANVGMVGVSNDLSFIAASNVACDSRGNHWTSIINAADRRILAVQRNDGTWLTLPAILGGIRLASLMESSVDQCLAVDAYDNLWATVRDPNYGGVISFGNGGAIDSVVAVHLNSANGLPSDQVKTIVADRENNIWVGTDRGIAIIIDPANPTRSGGIAAYKPLSGLVINTIAVDPLNQKWVGTSEGIVLLSPDGTQQLATYSVESTAGKLIDNDVRSIAFDPRSGTAYFGTPYGLASLSTPAAAPKASFDQLFIYPNPYRIPNPVPLTIDGLVAGSSMKILSVDGRLIRELQTPGGRLGFWDGKDQGGNDVSSGVYIVVGYSEDGTKVGNGKVAVLRK